MTIVLNGTTGITNDGGYTGDGVVFANTTPANTLVTTTGGNVGIGNTAANVNDQVGAVRPLLVSKSDTSTTIAGSQATIVIGNADTTTSNTSQLTFAALTGANTTYFASAAINCVFGARTNGQYPTGQLVFSTSTSLNSAPTEKMRLDSSGNVGIGTSSPTAKLEVYDASSAVARVTAGTEIFEIRNTGSEVRLAVVSADPMTFRTSNVEAMRIDSSGNLLVGKTSTSSTATGVIAYGTGAADHGMISVARGSNATMIEFRTTASGNVVGQISQNGTNTTYSTSSDYRLKENIQPMTGALAKVQALKPCTYKWKADGSDGQGFIAHELAEVAPQCVTGEKDAVDADGNPQYQGIDTSFLVATLTAAIQELKAINDAQAETITALTARVTALEGA